MTDVKEILGLERLYVLRRAEELEEATIERIEHPYATDTCREKITLLRETHPRHDWKSHHAIKACYGRVDEGVYGFVFPEFNNQRTQLVTPEIVRNVFGNLGLDPPYDSKFIAEIGSIPLGMEPGTCTPFVSAEEMGELEMIFIHDFPQLNDQIVDVSIGGKGEYFHRVSLHLPYKAIYDILEQQYGKEKVKKVRFF